MERRDSLAIRQSLTFIKSTSSTTFFLSPLNLPSCKSPPSLSRKTMPPPPTSPPTVSFTCPTFPQMLCALAHGSPSEGVRNTPENTQWEEAELRFKFRSAEPQRLQLHRHHSPGSPIEFYTELSHQNCLNFSIKMTFFFFVSPSTLIIPVVSKGGLHIRITWGPSKLPKHRTHPKQIKWESLGDGIQPSMVS